MPASAPYCGSRAAFQAALLAFLNGPLFARRGAAHAGMRVDHATLLFDTGVVDSLGIIDLLAFVEDATGHQIPLRQIDTRFFGSVERIVRTFWVEEERV